MIPGGIVQFFFHYAIIVFLFIAVSVHAAEPKKIERKPASTGKKTGSPQKNTPKTAEEERKTVSGYFELFGGAVFSQPLQLQPAARLGLNFNFTETSGFAFTDEFNMSVSADTRALDNMTRLGYFFTLLHRTYEIQLFGLAEYHTDLNAGNGGHLQFGFAPNAIIRMAIGPLDIEDENLFLIKVRSDRLLWADDTFVLDYWNRLRLALNFTKGSPVIFQGLLLNDLYLPMLGGLKVSQESVHDFFRVGPGLKAGNFQSGLLYTLTIASEIEQGVQIIIFLKF